MFSPEKDLSRLIVESLGKDGKSISSLDKDLTEKGIKNHRLVLTGYLRAMKDLGFLRAREVPPAIIYTPAKQLPESLYQTVKRQCRRLKGVDTDEVILYTLNRLFKRPIFESELHLADVMRPLGIQADESAVNEAKKILRRAGNVIPADNAYLPAKEYPDIYPDILAAIVLEEKDSYHLVMGTKQTKLI
ncbi:MAG: hypothetical protein WCQ63_00825 [Methanomethylophilus sp.]|nr:hypothetical protein [Methanomethylophilus sp.]MDD4668884.1 hypothetical protein [Methanomethylophilus sp.]